MIDALVADLEMEITESEVTEKDSQQDYEQAMSDAKEKRASDSKALTEKQATQAELEGSLEDNTAQKSSDEKKLMATQNYITSLHAECDWLLKYYDMRKEARAGEIDSLGKATAVLNGADFSALIQTKKFLHKSATADEDAAIASYDQLLKATKKELTALNKQIEVKLGRIGELAVEIVQMKNDLTDAQEALVENTKFLKEVKQDCSTKAEEFQIIVKTRQEELLALADTTKLLNDDDALELFKKTLPGGSALIQFAANSNNLRSRALLHVQMAADRAFDSSPPLDFISLALKGKKIGFEKVTKLINDLIAELKQDQINDDSKKEYCAAQFDIADDKKKSLTKSISDLETAIIEAKDDIVTFKDEIRALEDGVNTLDKQVAEQTEQRKEEHVDFSELMSSNGAAKELFGFAKNRLNKFYNPKLYKPPSFIQIKKTTEFKKKLKADADPRDGGGEEEDPQLMQVLHDSEQQGQKNKLSDMNLHKTVILSHMA